jgi:hypothetical protein
MTSQLTDRPSTSSSERRRALYHALKATGFNQSRAAAVMGFSRETIRQRLLDVGGFEGLIAWAVESGVASKAEADALSALASLAPANRHGANHQDSANPAKPHGPRHLTGVVGRPIFAANMSAVPIAMPPSSSSIRVDGDNRAFLKRLAVEVSLQMGTAREDMSAVVALMIEFFREKGDPGEVTALLVQRLREEQGQ